MKETLLALVTGLIVGLVFSSLKLPLPAPNVLPGVAGIIGIYLGGVLFEYLLKIIGR
ncbi:XapX domain protein [Thermoanaerobacter mathranii subsp. mathranii str. A3]|uniref:XapX domain protein n=3 Tax=Thermoanaerobacter TaxID=1754 RepID=D3T6D6_THEIA|nr:MULTISPECIES: XapX domain-containing protein [Thermoanaerobacter]ADD03530.1 XapX domain protein [Thermoanaerobacter italicus Ab9]ADH61900.1 XapX domain protein [Thermoanaerobacter mathranii subsp. mathranii str. A3]MBT1279344.1 XapX domain-containing protein [Thermoanaerobacter sp. CM-CNRG TB177]MDP9750215.1 XapX domain-containing protein [Thermoanaerobacter pentosaceus]